MMDPAPGLLLIAEDDDAHAEAMRRELAAAYPHCQITIARSLQEFRELSAAQAPDLALLDLHLPDGLALEALGWAPESRTFPVLIATSHGSEQSAVESLKAGASDYIVKSPDAFGALPRTVAHTLREWTLMRERKLAEEALRERDQVYRLLFENTTEAILLSQPDGTVFSANPAACRMFGLTEEEICRRGRMGLVDPSESRAPAAVEERDRTGKFSGELNHVRKDGTVFPVEMTSNLYRDSTGLLRGSSILRDVTERKRLEAQREGERLALEMLARGEPLAKALNALADGFEQMFPGVVCSLEETDPTGCFLIRLASQRLPQPYREYASRVAIGPFSGACGAAAHFRERVVCRDIATDRRWDERRESALASGLRACVSQPVFSSKGAVLGTFSVFFREPREPRPKEVAALERGAYLASLPLERHRAVEALAASEARFRSLYTKTPVMLHSVDRDGVLVSVSDYWLATLGYAPEEVLGRPAVDFFTEASRQIVISEGMEELYGKGVIRDRPRQFVKKDGGIIDVELSAIAEKGPSGEIERFLAVLIDVTERKRAEAAREQLESQLRQAQKMEALGTLAGGIAHDFNNILAAILGNAELARLYLGETDLVGTSLDEILRACERAKNLVSQILAFSRAQPHERQVLRLQEVVAEAVRLARASIPAGVEIHTTLSPNAPAVRADATQIHQVVVNLVTNAWHAFDGPTGQIEIELRTAPPDALLPAGLVGGKFTRMRVSDNGRGMDVTTLERIFEPFFTTKGAGRGTGLGLAVVHGIVRSHGGGVDVCSEPGRGTTFDVYFPAVATEPAATDQPSAPVPASDGGGRRLLFVDDEAALLAVLPRSLEARGYQVVAHADARDALAEVKAEPGAYDVVVTDFNMPGLSGLAFAREVAGIAPALRVVLATGFIDDAVRLAAAEAGVRQVVLKPFTLDELCAAIELELTR